MQPEVRTTPTFTCATCGDTTPISERHVCKLSAKQIRAIADGHAAERQRIEKKNEPRQCPDCSEWVAPRGGGHLCRPPVSDRALADALAADRARVARENSALVIADLKAQGYVVKEPK